MKKTVFAVMALILMLSLFACSKNNENGESTTFDYDSVLTETGVELDIGSVIIE